MLSDKLKNTSGQVRSWLRRGYPVTMTEVDLLANLLADFSTEAAALERVVPADACEIAIFPAARRVRPLELCGEQPEGGSDDAA